MTIAIQSGPRFKCMIVDDDDMLVISDHTYISEIGRDGACESIETTVASMLRQFKRLKEREAVL